ncbi:hypothetical protein JCGZ_14853 [Jatropha curcas]|uniref:Uncharacterized protein n=1 Tax=Jatropha curcas TaxID=180498 RepID=A0A067K9D3_JATCU|nr:putative F-box protein At3g10240 [Jatropha curcas]XP_012079728.1 putative F-box protein At3g10240 [Jatropha curcas]KDP31628.1 hypothetical protein JCGZ_14853 [Jatropha curcas]
MANSGEKKNVGLLKSVEERALSKKVEDEQKRQNVPYFHKDCISNILIRLPLESLQSSRFVCKPWYNIINSPIFIDAHLRRSESVLIFLESVQNERYPYLERSMPTQKPNYFSVESSFLQSKPVPIFGQPVNTLPKFRIQFLEFKEGKSKVTEYKVSCLGLIRATCNGLILLDNKLKKGGLLVMNPVTRKLMALPLGTIYPPQNESYGFALSNTTGEYKVVHLFRDELGYVSCEILNIGTRFWREVNGPSFGLFGWFGYEPVSAIGALHWVPQVDHNDYIVSMEVDNEKFHTIRLPENCRTYDRIIEMAGLLCLVVHEELNIDIWNLKSIGEGVWTKQYSITRGSVLDMVPMFSLRISGDIIFKRAEDGSFYAYDFRFQEMRKVEIDKKCFPFSGTYLPHVNSLVSWMPSQNVCD